MLRIYLLGPFRVEHNGQVLAPQAWARPKDRTLLKLLALQAGHVVPQDRLLETLWPDLAPSAAANSLHVAVSRLRKLLGAASLIRRETAGYMLTPGEFVWIDVEEFHRVLGRGREWRQRGVWAAAAQAYRSAETLYRGELCEDDPYEQWAVRPREELREAYLLLLEELSDCLLHLGAQNEAIMLCERGLAGDSTREGLYVQLMRAHAAAGHLAEALQAYERCRRALADELGVDPGPAARAMHAQLLQDDELGAATLSVGRLPLDKSRPDASSPGTGQADLNRLQLPCVGRERELSELAARLDEAAADHGRLVLLHGEPGIGKSRLLQEFGRLAETRGARSISARCYELERDLPYAPIADALGSFLAARIDPAEVSSALGQWGSQLGALMPTLHDLVADLPRHQPLRPDAERAAILAGLGHVFASLSRGSPLVLLLDDLQWADASTIQWLHYLARRLTGLAVLIVGTYRTGEIGPDHPLQVLIEGLGRDPTTAALLIELSCLGIDDAAALLPALTELAARLHHETDGHPLFLVETLRTLVETGVVRVDERGVMVETGTTLPTFERRLPLPPNLSEAIRWRISRLNDRERRVLMAAAVASRGFHSELLGTMTELEREAVLNALEALVGRQLLRLSPAGSGFDFRHDLIQEVVYAGLSPDRRRSLHSRAAAALLSRVDERQIAVEDVAGELAHHWRQAECWAPAVQYALIAGDHARASFAPREALAHYQRAVDIAEHRPDLLQPADRAGLLERLGRAYAELGQPDAAVEQFQLLHELARQADDPRLEGRALASLADAHYWRHDFARAEATAADALALAEELDDRGLRAASLSTAASAAIARGHTTDAERDCRAVLALTGERPPEGGNEEPIIAGARLSALGWLGLLGEQQSDHQRATPFIEASLRLGQELHNPFLTGRSRFALGMSLGNRGRYEDALTTLNDAFRLAEEGGDRYFLPRLPNTIGWVYSELGDLRQAAEWNERSVALARETGWLEAEANALVNLGSDALRTGHRAQAREYFERAAALIDRDNWFSWRYRMRLLIGLGKLALVEAVPERALSFAQEALGVAEPTGSRKHAGRAWLLRGQAMLAAGAPLPDVLTQLVRARSLAHASDHPPLVWSSARALAQVYAGLGKEVEAAVCRDEARSAIESVAAGLRDSARRRAFLASDTIQ